MKYRGESGSSVEMEPSSETRGYLAGRYHELGLSCFRNKSQVSPPSKRREFGKLVIGSLNSSSRKAGAR